MSRLVLRFPLTLSSLQQLETNHPWRDRKTQTKTLVTKKESEEARERAFIFLQSFNSLSLSALLAAAIIILLGAFIRNQISSDFAACSTSIGTPSKSLRSFLLSDANLRSGVLGKAYVRSKTAIPPGAESKLISRG